MMSRSPESLMPLHEYKCHRCGDQFELLLRGSETAACPSCQSTDLERLLSLFGVSSEATRQSSLTKARRAGAKERRDKQHAEREAIEHHSH